MVFFSHGAGNKGTKNEQKAGFFWKQFGAGRKGQEILGNSWQ
jgi:hypothetical protein